MRHRGISTHCLYVCFTLFAPAANYRGSQFDSVRDAIHSYFVRTGVPDATSTKQFTPTDLGRHHVAREPRIRTVRRCAARPSAATHFASRFDRSFHTAPGSCNDRSEVQSQVAPWQNGLIESPSRQTRTKVDSGISVQCSCTSSSGSDRTTEPDWGIDSVCPLFSFKRCK